MDGESKKTDQSDGRPSRKKIVRILVIVAVLVIVFGWLLPQIIDYETVWTALTGLTFEQFLLLLVLGALRVPTEAMIYRAMLPGLRLLAGSEAYLSSNVGSNFLPPPASSIIQYAYFRAEEFDTRSSMTAAVGTFVFPQAGRVILPIVAFVVLLFVDQVDDEALIITAISAVLVVVICVLVWMIGRSESSARWLGAKLGSFISWVMTKLHKDPVGDLGDQVVEFRDNAYAVVAKRWPLGTIGTAFNLLLTYLILVASLRAVGIESTSLGLAVIFACFSVAFFAGVVIPITGSGLGVVDVVMVSALSASTTGSVDVNIIVAAVVLWRLFYGLLALIPGTFTLMRFSSANPDVLKNASSEFSGEDESSGRLR